MANEDAGRTSVVDIASGKLIASIPVGIEPEGVAVAPNGRWVFVTNESDHAVSVIDARTLKVVRYVSVGQRPRDIAFAPDSSVAYVTGELDASLYRMGLQGDEPATRVLQLRKEARPMAMALDAERKRLYMSTGRGGTVAVMDLAHCAAAGYRSAGRNTALGNRSFQRMAAGSIRRTVPRTM